MAGSFSKLVVLSCLLVEPTAQRCVPATVRIKPQTRTLDLMWIVRQRRIIGSILAALPCIVACFQLVACAVRLEHD